MKNLFKRYFKKTKVVHFGFHSGTDGRKKQEEFLKWVNKYEVEILNCWTEYDHWNKNHVNSINFIVRYKI